MTFETVHGYSRPPQPLPTACPLALQGHCPLVRRSLPKWCLGRRPAGRLAAVVIQKFCKVKSSLQLAFLCILYLAPLSLGLKITKHKAAFNNLSLNGNSEGVKCIVDFKSPRRYDESSASALHRWSNSIYNTTIKNVVVE